MIDTRVPGNPADLRAAGTYLAATLAGGITALADTVVGQRSTLASGWEGEAGAAFTERATILARTGDEVGGAAAALGHQFEALASTLEVVQLGMGAVRAEAVAAGLRVQGHRILPPRSGPEVAAYDAAAARRDDLLRQWYDALTQTAAFLEANSTSVGQATLNLLVAGYTAALKYRLATVMTAQKAHKLAEADRFRSLADDLTDALRHQRIAPQGFYDQLDELTTRGRQSLDDAAEAGAAARNPKLPASLARGLWAVGPLAAGYGVYDDQQNGESTEQAVVSQGGGLLSGMVAGGATGAALGTAGMPVVGTIAGGVVGAAVGLVVSDRIDQHYEQEAEDRAETERQADLQHLELMLNASEGLPLYSTPGSDKIYGE